MLVAAGIIVACTTAQPTPGALPGASAYPSVSAPAVQLYRVDSVYDGDTLRVFTPDGRSVPVRVLGIDAPEMRAPVPPEDLGRSDAPEPHAECGAVNARDLARSLLLGNSVSLQEDPEQGDKDNHGRLLRYVTLPDGKDLAEQLLASGWVQVYTQYPVAKTPSYLHVQQTALDSEVGGWAMCGWEN